MDCPPPPAHVVPLLDALSAPRRALAFSEPEWDRVLRMARSARLHGLLAEQIAALDAPRLPAAVALQLDSARSEARFARAMVLHELDELRRALAELGVELLLLKGAAYITQQLDCALGRLPADLDVMVRREDFARVERALIEAGWRPVELGSYDTHYYRRWSHQAPPMRAPGHAIELDLHHAILPPRGRLRIDSARLWQRSVAIGERLRVLDRTDQVLHAVVHLFVDSDCTHRLRDLVDIARMIDQFKRDDAGFVTQLQVRARELAADAPLAHAAAFAKAWLGVVGWDPPRRAGLAGRAVRALVGRRLAPPDPDSLPACTDPALALLAARSLAQRLPWHLALLHASSRPLRRSLNR
jgi:hypothetical protein